jgi:hypothetical protein
VLNDPGYSLDPFGEHALQLFKSDVVPDGRNCLDDFISCRRLLFLKFFFEKTKQPKVRRVDVGRINWVRGSFDFIMFQFQTNFSSIMAHRVVHMDNKIELRFLAAVRPSVEKVMV